MFNRMQYGKLCARLKEPRRFMQVLSGPRQVGKTTLAKQAIASFDGLGIYASADLPSTPDAQWIAQQWETARRASRTQSCLLRVPHWCFAEMREAFGWSVEQFIYFGGYPGAASLISEQSRWRDYVLDSIIEPTLSKDVLQLSRIDKPALLRRLFVLGCHYSGQILSYQKMVGQLQDVGNTSTLSNYLNLLSSAWMLTGLDKFAGDVARSRASSPKLLALNTAFISAQLGLTNYKASVMTLQYWRERNHEVDFILSQGDRLTAIEVKSGRRKGSFSGLKKFTQNYSSSQSLVVGKGGVPLEAFLLASPEQWVSGKL
jgi:predicted AAA+ superfamily ATPase